MVVVEARRLSRFLIVETQVEGKFYVNKKLEELMFEELRQHCGARGKLSASIALTFDPGVGGFLPACKQIANVAALPGIVGVRREF